MNKLTISKLSKIVGFPPKTIRFYEESGLITPANRGENGYRLFDDSSISRLQLIKQARDLGLPISEIKKLMVGCDEKGCAHTQEYFETEVKNYIQLLEEKITQYTLLKNKLEQLNTKIESDKEKHQNCSYCCNILGQLLEERKGGELPMNENCTCCGSKCECTTCKC